MKFTSLRLRLHVPFFFFLMIVYSCQKINFERVDDPISQNEIVNWVGQFQEKIMGMPNPVWSSAQKAYVHDMMIVRVPLETGGGQLLFAKRKFDKNLEVKFFRKVENPNSGKKQFTGFYETIDLTNYVYHKIDFVNGNIVNQLTTKSINTDDVLPLETITLGGGNGWLSAFWYCFKRYIFAIPKWVNGGWECYGLGGSGSGSENEVELPEGEDGGGGGLNQNIQILFPPILPFPQPPSPWNPYDLNPISIGGGSFPSEIIPNPNVLGNFIDDPSVFEDDPMQVTFDFDQEPWPRISNVLSTATFVGYDYRNCLTLAKDQISKAGLRDLGYASVFKVYDSNGGPYQDIAKYGINYIITKLQSGKPVIVGVDNRPGTPNANNPDGKTDHFVTIVGAGQDSQGIYLTFYDNASNLIVKGTSVLNKLYYDSKTGIIKGKSAVPYANAYGDYIITQIRKNQ